MGYVGVGSRPNFFWTSIKLAQNTALDSHLKARRSKFDNEIYQTYIP